MREENKGRKSNKKKKRKKRLIEIKTRRNKWQTVELLSINKGGSITVKSFSGEITYRNKRTGIHWGIIKRVDKNLINK